MVRAYEKKKRARYAVAKNLDRGTISQYCCQSHGCMADNYSEAHHPDYDLPLAVIWFCRLHHAKEHAYIRRLPRLQRIDYQQKMVELAQCLRGPSLWSIEEALRGFAEPTEQEEEDWGSIEDFQDTIIEYDREEVERSQATSEDCPPTFTHPMDAPQAAGLPDKANV